MMKKIVLFVGVCVLSLAMLAGCGKKDDKDAMFGTTDQDGKKAAISKEKFMEYLTKKLAIVGTPEYADAMTKYKAEAEDVKEILDRQKIFDKYFGDYKKKEADLLNSCGLTLGDVVTASTSFKSDKEVMDLVYKLMKYVVY